MRHCCHLCDAVARICIHPCVHWLTRATSIRGWGGSPLLTSAPGLPSSAPGLGWGAPLRASAPGLACDAAACWSAPRVASTSRWIQRSSRTRSSRAGAPVRAECSQHPALIESPNTARARPRCKPFGRPVKMHRANAARGVQCGGAAHRMALQRTPQSVQRPMTSGRVTRPRATGKR